MRSARSADVAWTAASAIPDAKGGEPAIDVVQKTDGIRGRN
jgi:hypothetical protein